MGKLGEVGKTTLTAVRSLRLAQNLHDVPCDRLGLVGWEERGRAEASTEHLSMDSRLADQQESRCGWEDADRFSPVGTANGNHCQMKGSTSHKCEPSETLARILAVIKDTDWKADKDRLRNDLTEFLTDDLFNGEYEFAGYSPSMNLRTAKQTWLGPNRVEFVDQGWGLPSKATLVRGPDCLWKLESYLWQCTGCLGTGEVLDGKCYSCSGTGWGLRPGCVST